MGSSHCGLLVRWGWGAVVVGLVFLLAFPTGGSCFRVQRFPNPASGLSRTGRSPIASNGYKYSVRYFTQVVDHFSFRPQGYATFQQRYLINDDHWDRDKGGPIFMYCGNEGAIDWFAVNTGLMWDIAPDFGAMLLFPEHRYYGESLPFGTQEESYRNASTLAFLTAEQALADFARLVVDLKANLSAEASPVVVFGGSYGGMLAAWFRLKYPHATVGAIASSAPILQFEHIVPYDVFNRIASDDFKRESETCFSTIKASWAEIDRVGAADEGLQQLTTQFRVCSPLHSTQELKDWLSDAYSFLAMTDYPTPADFVMPLPAWPIREVCRQMDSLPPSASILDRIFAGVTVYYNYTGGSTCFETAADPHGMDGWSYQACTEMVMPMSSNASNSMFEPYQWDYAGFAAWCNESFGVMPRPHWVPTQFGGRDIKHALHQFGSNIVFANGLLDPWSGGGVLEDISDSIVAIVIESGAHHLDLRAATPDDPPEIIHARQAERYYIHRWIRESRIHGGRSFSPARAALLAAALAAVACGALGVGLTLLAVHVREQPVHRGASDDGGFYTPLNGTSNRSSVDEMASEEVGEARQRIQWP